MLVIAPHPDDEVLGCSARLRTARSHITYVTPGVPWFVPRSARDRASVAAMRLRESKSALAHLCQSPPTTEVLDFVDGAVAAGVLRLADAVAHRLKALQPRVMLVPAFDNGHPDHDATYVACWLARERVVGEWIGKAEVYALYRLDEAGRVRFGSLTPHLYRSRRKVPLHGSLRDHKLAAVGLIKSQLGEGSTLRRWLLDPGAEEYGAMPAACQPPVSRCYYDEVMELHRFGITSAAIHLQLTAVLAEADSSIAGRV